MRPGGGGPDGSGYASEDGTSSTLAEVYYSSKGYLFRRAAIFKLAKAAGLTESRAEECLVQQAIWQICLPVPRYIPDQSLMLCSRTRYMKRTSCFCNMIESEVKREVLLTNMH